VTKSYDYTPGGMRLSQSSHNSDGTTANGYYSYNDHSDVEAVTGASGGTKTTYGYTAYGQDDKTQFTGADKTAPQPGTQPFNPYRFNAMRWDSSAGQYDMGFRNYDPDLNQFLSRDMYEGALADIGLTTDPFTGSRYTFGAGNPITNTELDGHMFPATTAEQPGIPPAARPARRRAPAGPPTARLVSSPAPACRAVLAREQATRPERKLQSRQARHPCLIRRQGCASRTAC